MNRLKQFLTDIFKMWTIGNPNSADGFRYRAWVMIRRGTAPDNPYVSVLVKRALLLEGKEFEIPDPDRWELMSASEKEEWVLAHIGKKVP